MTPTAAATPASDDFAEAIAAARSGEPARARACAEAMTAKADALGPEQAAEALAHAATCWEIADAFGEAVRTRELLVQRFPQAPVARLALLALARQYSVIAAFDRAAAAIEQLTQQWAGDPETVDRLVEAARLRAGLGQDERARALLGQAEQLVGARDPKRAAAIFWSRRSLAPALREHAVAYLERHGLRGGPELRIVAEVAIAESDWRRACKQGEAPSGLCAKSRPALNRAPKGCADRSTEVLTVYPRQRQLTAAAQARLREILKLGAILPPVDDPLLRWQVHEALDVAALIVADAALEDRLRENTFRMPSGLGFFVEERRRDAASPRDRKIYAEQVRRRDDSIRRFREFWQQAQRAAQELGKRYQTIISGKRSPRGMLAAAARLAVVSQVQVDMLLAAELPPGLGSEAVKKAYCNALRDQVAPVQTAARQALEYCLTRAVEFGHRDASVAFCEAELSRRWPGAFPRLTEIVPEQATFEPPPELVPLQQRPPAL